MNGFLKPHYEVQSIYGIPQGDSAPLEPADPQYLREVLGESGYMKRFPSRFDPYACEQTAYVSVVWCLPNLPAELAHCRVLPTGARACIDRYEALRKRLEGVALLEKPGWEPGWAGLP